MLARLAFISCAALGITSSLPSSASAGDFGRPRYFWEAEPPPVVIETPEASILVGPFPWTDEERELRKLADGIIYPVEPVFFPFWAAPLPPYDAWDPTLYATDLLGVPFRSSAARYSRLLDDIRNDLQRWETLQPAWAVVADLDVKRHRSLRYVSHLSADELALVNARIAENRALVATARQVLLNRCAAYRFAMERLVIAQPSRMAIEAERELQELERRLGVTARGVGPRRPVPVAIR